jgi:Protein of unknown function (DUF3108)
MAGFRALRALLAVVVLLTPIVSSRLTGQTGKAQARAIESPLPPVSIEKSHPLPAGTEVLQYGVEWRLIYAGDAKLTLHPGNATMHLESGGLVSRLFKVKDDYAVNYQDASCAVNMQFDAIEGKRHRETKVVFDRQTKKASYVERDVLKNSIVRNSQTDIPPCVHDVVGALMTLRTMRADVGQSVQLPVSDGRKTVNVKIEAQEREEIRTKVGVFKTVRYEALIFDGVLFQRKAKAFVWLSDDARKVPVQFRIRMPITIGTITLQLEKEEHW